MTNTKTGTVVKAGIWYTITNFLTKGAVFITTPIFTRLMSTDGVGAYGNITTWFSLLVCLTTFDLYTALSLARFDYKDELDEFTSSTLVFGSLITALFYGIVLLKFDFFCELLKMEGYALHLIFIYMMVYPSLQMYQSKNMFQYRYKTSTAVSLVTLLLSTIVSLLLTIYSEDKLWGRTIGNYIPLIISCAVVYVYLMIKGRRVRLKYLKYSVKIAFPMIWHTLSMYLLGAGDRIVITQILGDTAQAMYTVAFNCCMIASAVWTSMNSAFSPWSTECMNRGDTQSLKKASYGYILLFTAVIFALLLVAPELLWLMGGDSYMEAKGVIPPIVVGCLCQFIYSLYVNAEFYLKKQTRIAIGTVASAVLNIVLNIIFIPRFGYVAAGYTTLIGYLALLLYHYVSLRMLGKGDLYDNKFNFMVLLVFLPLIPICNVLYEYNAVRYVLILVIGSVAGVVCVKYRKKIFGLLKSILVK